MKHWDAPPDRQRHGSINLHAKGRRRLDHVGYEDAPPLSLQTLDGEHPRGRELSIAWLAGTVMTGITSVMLMGAALYVAFDGRESFSTASQALSFGRTESVTTIVNAGKTDRIRPRTETRSELEVVQASIRTMVDGRTVIRSQAFTRVDVTLATAETPLTADVPAFDPSAIVASAAQPNDAAPTPEIYAANVDGEVVIAMSPLPAVAPVTVISDRQAVEFAKLALEDSFVEGPAGGPSPITPEVALGYAPPGSGALGIAENVTAVTKSLPEREGGGRSERIVTLQQEGALEALLLKNGFTERSYQLVATTLRNVLPSLTLPAGAKLRILMGPSRTSAVPIPYRLSIYVHDPKTQEIKHAATAAMTDRGGYVIGLEPGAIEFPDEDIEAVDVNALPSLYRSIWETARKYDIDDQTTSQIVGMFAYELDLTQKVRPGDGLKLLATKSPTGQAELLYAALTTGGTTRELFRFRTPDGTVDYYSPDGETGKRFLMGLVADGVVGDVTREALNRSGQITREQLLVNLEKWRWLPRERGDYRVEVNIPEFRLWIRRGGEIVHETRVVVGTPANQTPIFYDQIRHVVVNPYWNVPVSIARNEIGPQVRRDPGYLARGEFELLNAGSVIDPWSIDWSSVAPGTFPFTVRQKPGSQNALGQVKFLFPNKHDVYLHDTPEKSLFGRDVRAYSHGCVRVENPFDFAEALLANEPSFGRDELVNSFGPREQWFNMEMKVPVYLTYFTVRADEDGSLRSFADVYGHDSRIAAALSDGTEL